MDEGTQQAARGGVPWLAAKAPDRDLMRLAVAAVFVLLGLLGGVSWANHRARTRDWPRDTFLYTPADSYGDFLHEVAKAGKLNPYFESRPACYFPLTYLVFAGVARWSVDRQVEAFLDLSLALALAACLAGAVAIRGPTAKALFLGFFAFVAWTASYPYIFAMDRGNLDPALASLSFLAMVLLVKDRPVAAALLLAVPAAMKGYPLGLVVVFAALGRWRCAALTVAATAALSAIALACFKGGLIVNWIGFRYGLYVFKYNYTLGMCSAHYCADPLNGMKIALRTWPGFAPRLVSFCVRHYAWFGRAGLLACCSYTVLTKAAFHRRLLAAVLAIMLYPNVVNDYKLINLAVALFFMATAAEPWDRGDHIRFWAVLLLLVPKNYSFISQDASISCIVSPLLLLLVLATLFEDATAWSQARASLAGLLARARRRAPGTAAG